uniref:Gustatory receptor 43a.2 n=1 Tax=Subpsaltria yangi TaxID=1195109 RepID=A0A385IUW6_9HEMI|nr:gustatory receptor 43a.2 [Subpsaltria yangi]
MVNTMFGWQLLVCILSLFTHTVVSPYYLFIVVFKPVSPFSASYKMIYHKIYILSQVIWILTHLLCLVYLMYYSHKTTEEANRTAVIVSQVINKNHSASFRKEMETLLLQFKYNRADVSVLGLYSLNLPVITSMGSSVAMYLFILIQFENS